MCSSAEVGVDACRCKPWFELGAWAVKDGDPRHGAHQ